MWLSVRLHFVEHESSDQAVVEADWRSGSWWILCDPELRSSPKVFIADIVFRPPADIQMEGSGESAGLLVSPRSCLDSLQPLLILQGAFQAWSACEFWRTALMLAGFPASRAAILLPSIWRSFYLVLASLTDATAHSRWIGGRNSLPGVYNLSFGSAVDSAAG